MQSLTNIYQLASSTSPAGQLPQPEEGQTLEDYVLLLEDQIGHTQESEQAITQAVFAIPQRQREEMAGDEGVVPCLFELALSSFDWHTTLHIDYQMNIIAQALRDPNPDLSLGYLFFYPTAVSPDLRFEEGDTLLHLAARRDAAVLNTLLSKYPNLHQAPSPDSLNDRGQSVWDLVRNTPEKEQVLQHWFYQERQDLSSSSESVTSTSTDSSSEGLLITRLASSAISTEEDEENSIEGELIRPWEDTASSSSLENGNHPLAGSSSLREIHDSTDREFEAIPYQRVLR